MQHHPFSKKLIYGLFASLVLIAGCDRVPKTTSLNTGPSPRMTENAQLNMRTTAGGVQSQDNPSTAPGYKDPRPGVVGTPETSRHEDSNEKS